MLVAQSCPTLRPHGLQPTSLLCPWNFPDKDTGVGCHFLLQGIFPPRDRTWASCAAGGLFTDWATREATAVVLGSVVQSRLFTTLDCGPPGSSVHGHSAGKSTGVGCHALLQGIFPTQGSNPGLPHGRQILYSLSHPGWCSPNSYQV